MNLTIAMVALHHGKEHNLLHNNNLGICSIPVLLHQLKKSGNIYSSKNMSWKMLETSVSHHNMQIGLYDYLHKLVLFLSLRLPVVSHK